MPHASEGAFVGTESGQASGDVRDVAVGVEHVGIAEEVSALAGESVAEDALAEGRLGDAGTEEVGRAPDGDADATGVRGGKQLPRHGRAGLDP